MSVQFWIFPPPTRHFQGQIISILTASSNRKTKMHKLVLPLKMFLSSNLLYKAHFPNNSEEK